MTMSSFEPAKVCVERGINPDRTLSDWHLMFIGNCAALSYADIQNKLTSLISSELYEKAVNTKWKKPVDASSGTSEQSVTLTEQCQFLHLCTRCNNNTQECPVRTGDVAKFIRRSVGKTNLNIVVNAELSQLVPVIVGIGRSFPLFNMKSSVQSVKQVAVEVITDKLSDNDLSFLTTLLNSVRSTARLVDTPANIMHTDAFVAHALDVAKQLGGNVSTTLIQGEDLLKQGFGGVYHVGKQSEHPPAFLVLSYKPDKTPDNAEIVCLVGKGIVYDTGGMQLKTKTGMPGMKNDMGGAAAMLGAFQVLAASGYQRELHCVLCIAENMIGPKANRPDDVITLLSGKTCEINNTDAEGRLVLADGVYYAKTTLKASTIVNMCTLTGAQRQATGNMFAAIMCNTPELTDKAQKAGHRAGEPCHPLPFSPNWVMPDLKSQLADMKNSCVGHTPQGAPSAVAAFFIGAQIGFYKPQWLHVDMASLAIESERSTAYGVALMSALFGHHTNVPLLQNS